MLRNRHSLAIRCRILRRYLKKCLRTETERSKKPTTIKPNNPLKKPKQTNNQTKKQKPKPKLKYCHQINDVFLASKIPNLNFINKSVTNRRASVTGLTHISSSSNSEN